MSDVRELNIFRLKRSYFRVQATGNAVQQNNVSRPYIFLIW